jgi:hypothetical protein
MRATLPRRAAKLVKIDRCIVAFLKDYRKNSHIGADFEGAYYWNEREVQWELFSHLRERTVSRSIGSRWWIHAEGSVERPRYARWERSRRADIVVVNHSKFKKWWKQRQGVPPYEAMIEVKIVWSGQSVANTVSKLRSDARKLASCLRGGKTREAHIVLLDTLSEDGLPCYSSQQIEELLGHLSLRPRIASRIHLWHWPDSEEKVENARKAPWHHYTGYV